MKTKREQSVNRKDERGNALIYVLIAIALFAALSFTLSRQTDTGETSALSDEKAELYATQLISHAAQVKSAIDQLLFTGATSINELDFMLPSDGNFNTAPVIHKVYHPEGGGITQTTLPNEAIQQVASTPPAGWYFGRFSNVEWTKTSADDVILVAYQINRRICENINLKVTGSDSIPGLTGSMSDILIDDSLHSGTNAEFTTEDPGDVCPECKNRSSMCVQNNFGTAFSFYTIIADQ